MLEKNEIAALLEALCEGPPDHGGPELQALRIAATKALMQARDADGDCSASPAGDDAFTLALAALLSGSDAEAPRTNGNRAAGAAAVPAARPADPALSR